jgi:predicted permease
MIEILIQLAPIFLYFGLGIVLKSTGVADRSHGEFMLRMVLMVTLPLMILSTLPMTTLTPNKAILPVANIAVSFACMLITLLLVKIFKVERKQAGTMLVSTMILNNTYMFPFILVVYGNEAFTDAILFDFGNAVLMSTYVYALAFKYGGEEHSSTAMLLKMAKSPIIWSIILSLVLAITGIPLPQLAYKIVNPLAQMTAPLILITLGIYFTINIKEVKLVAITVFVRMGMGLLFGIAIANYLKLQETAFIVVALCGAAPIGFNALTFSSIAKLDTDLSSSAVSVSILAGLVYFPLLMLYFGVP